MKLVSLTLFLVITLGAVGGLATLAQFRVIKAELSQVRQELRVAKDRAARFERRLEAAETAFRNPAEANASSRRPIARKLTLSADEVQLIRDFIKVPPAPPGAPALNLGEVAETTVAIAIPSTVVERVPQLKGAAFAADGHGGIVIIGPSKRVEAIIPLR
jgi:hypothetical protein